MGVHLKKRSDASGQIAGQIIAEIDPTEHPGPWSAA
jgi:hypothetical protein